MVQLTSLPLAVSCFSKIQIGFTFLVGLTRVIPEKGPLNRCMYVCIYYRPSCLPYAYAPTFRNDYGPISLCPAFHSIPPPFSPVFLLPSPIPAFPFTFPPSAPYAPPLFFPPFPTIHFPFSKLSQRIWMHSGAETKQFFTCKYLSVL